MGLAERAKNNPLKVLKPKLNYESIQKRMNFIKDQESDKTIKEALTIIDSYTENLSLVKYMNIFKILLNTYLEYINQLQIIKEITIFKKYKYRKYNKTSYEEKELAFINLINENNSDNLKTNFELIKQSEEFKELIKKEDKIRIDFHGISDFDYLIKGVSNELIKPKNYVDNEIVEIIIKNIERNFGGIKYEIDIDFSLIDEDSKAPVEKIKKLLTDYGLYKNKEIIKLDSVQLFKILYNFQCSNLEPNSNLKIDKSKIKEYNEIQYINDNITDINSRYLLLEIKPSLRRLLLNIVKKQNPSKDILYIEESPFDEDNKYNNPYILNKIKKIQNYLKDDKLIIVDNSNWIHPLLYNLYARNFELLEGRKFIRISYDEIKEPLTSVNEKLRLIILADEKYWKKSDASFLSKFEKICISFDKLISNKSKALYNNLFCQIDLNKIIKEYNNNNYSLKDLLINFSEVDIMGLIDMNVSSNNNNIDELKIKDNVINKISNILPQDIIVILPDNNIIKEKYCSKTVFNLIEYINHKERKKYKISVIYTFTPISNSIKGLDTENGLMISEIKNENQLNKAINNIRHKNEDNKNLKNKDYIYIRFEQQHSNKISFICNFILQHFKSDKNNYIIIIHIKRNFKWKLSGRIDSIPNIEPDINQIFIDNLNGNNEITFGELLSNDIITILELYKDELKLDDEFNKTLYNCLKKEKREKFSYVDNYEEYMNEIQSYLNEETKIKIKINEVIFKFTKNNKELNLINIIRRIYKNNMINQYTVDFSSFLIEYIKEDIYNKNLKIIIQNLEDNNILAYILNIKNDNYIFLTKNQVEIIIKDYLKEIKPYANNICERKFLSNYNVPAFYNFFIYISHYIKLTVLNIIIMKIN